MRNLPTDLEILNVIYNDYYEEFSNYMKEKNNTRSVKIYVPINIDKIAEKLNVDGDIIFGRLYYHLEKKYGYRNEDESNVHFFARVLDGDIHCINFPLMASILADLRDNKKRYYTAITIAVGSLIVSLISVAISIIR